MFVSICIRFAWIHFSASLVCWHVGLPMTTRSFIGTSRLLGVFVTLPRWRQSVLTCWKIFWLNFFFYLSLHCVWHVATSAALVMWHHCRLTQLANKKTTMGYQGRLQRYKSLWYTVGIKVLDNMELCKTLFNLHILNVGFDLKSRKNS